MYTIPSGRLVLLPFTLVLLLLLAACGGLGGSHGSTSQQGGGGGGGSTGSLQSSVNHIIFMAQENRSFDVYFGHLNDYRTSQGLGADVDGMPANASCPNDPAGPEAGTNFAAFHLITMCIENTSADWGASHIDYNYWHPTSDAWVGDGFIAEAAASSLFNGTNDILGHRAMGYYTAADLPYHYWLATTFATSDRWFAGAPVETMPNRMYLIAATSAGHAHTPTQGTSLFNVKTIFDELQAAGISWKIYYTNTDPSTGAPVTEFTYFQPFASQHMANVVPIAQYFTDLQNGTLPQVAFIDPGFLSGQDEHPGLGNSVQVGAAYTKKLIDALMSSSAWKDSVFILTFDEGGGLYDHVPPPTGVPSPDGIAPKDLFSTDATGDFTRYGFRVPLMVVSPFTKAHYVSHTSTDFTAIVKFIETRFNLPALTKRDAAAADMSEFFDFSNPPYMTPPTNIPGQPTNGPCHDGLP